MKQKTVCGSENQDLDWLIETQPKSLLEKEWTMFLTCGLYQRLRGFEECALDFELVSDSL